MARGDLLFSTDDLSWGLLAHEKSVREAIDKADPNKFLNANTSDLAAAFMEDHRVNPLILHEDKIQMDQRETKVDVRGDPYRMIYDWSQPFYIKGTEIDFFVPCEGDAPLFNCRPNHFSLSPPRGDVRNGELALRYIQTQANAESVKQEFDRDLAAIKQYLASLAEQAARFNAELQAKISQWINARRDRLLANQSMVASLGYPMRRRACVHRDGETLSVKVGNEVRLRLLIDTIESLLCY